MLRWDSISERMDERRKKVLSQMQALCARREYCIADIRKKLSDRLEGAPEAEEEILSSLLKDKFVDERRYASAFVSEKSSLTGWGPVKIRRALSAKGVAAEVIDAALSEMDRDKADAKLEKLLSAKWRTLQGDPQARLKLLRHALSRGYLYDEVRPIAERLTSGRDADEI